MLLINKVKELASLSILTDQINYIIIYSNDMKEDIKPYLNQSNYMSMEEARNCENWKRDIEKYQLKNLVFDADGRIRLKDDLKH